MFQRRQQKCPNWVPLVCLGPWAHLWTNHCSGGQGGGQPGLGHGSLLEFGTVSELPWTPWERVGEVHLSKRTFRCCHRKRGGYCDGRTEGGVDGFLWDRTSKVLEVVGMEIPRVMIRPCWVRGWNTERGESESRDVWTRHRAGRPVLPESFLCLGSTLEANPFPFNLIKTRQFHFLV